jgi:hypothetical protein
MEGEQFADKKVRWADFIKFCEKLKFGEIEKLKIQDGVPCAAEIVTQKIKFQ